MLTVLIETLNDEEGLARTLSSLVGGAVEGIVRDVLVRDMGSSDHTASVAEHAGCMYLAGAGMAETIARAKGDWLLLLEPGARLEGGWTEAVVAHVSHQTGPARFSRHGGRPFLVRIFPARQPLADGLLISKRDAGKLARPGADAAAMARGGRAGLLGATIFPAPRR